VARLAGLTGRGALGAAALRGAAVGLAARGIDAHVVAIDEAALTRALADTLDADLAGQAHLATAAAALSAAFGGAAVRAVGGRRDATPAAIDPIGLARETAASGVADFDPVALFTWAAEAAASATGRGAAEIAIDLGIDAGRLAVDEAARARQRAVPGIADLAAVAALPGAAAAG
jgi:hypothetical protein